MQANMTEWFVSNTVTKLLLPFEGVTIMRLFISMILIAIIAKLTLAEGIAVAQPNSDGNEETEELWNRFEYGVHTFSQDMENTYVQGFGAYVVRNTRYWNSESQYVYREEYGFGHDQLEDISLFWVNSVIGRRYRDLILFTDMGMTYYNLPQSRIEVSFQLGVGIDIPFGAKYSLRAHYSRPLWRDAYINNDSESFHKDRLTGSLARGMIGLHTRF